jgi:hypothetical protein
MRGEQRQGRFDIPHERESIIKGTTKELVRTVGYIIEWWLYRDDLTIVDPIYDVGSDGAEGGRHWHGPHHIPVINATLTQGVTMENERGLYNTDVLNLLVNMDVIDGSALPGGVSLLIPELRYLPSNPDAYLRDRIVFKNEVFSPRRIVPKGIITDDYTLFGVECHQVNAEEMVNDPQFQQFSTYSPFDPKNKYVREGLPE